MLSVANKIYDNYTNKENKFSTVKRTNLNLIACTQGNGIGKTTFLNMLEFFVPYIVKDETYTDLCRGSKVKIFDLYFDKFGHGAVQKIAWGYGKVSPRIWGYKAP